MSKAQIKADKFLQHNNLFEKAWHKFDKSKSQTGMIDMMESHKLMKLIIPHAEAQTSDLENEIAKTISAVDASDIGGLGL